jgi:hypothetical protein
MPPASHCYSNACVGLESGSKLLQHVSSPTRGPVVFWCCVLRILGWYRPGCPLRGRASRPYPYMRHSTAYAAGGLQPGRWMSGGDAVPGQRGELHRHWPTALSWQNCRSQHGCTTLSCKLCQEPRAPAGLGHAPKAATRGWLTSCTARPAPCSPESSAGTESFVGRLPAPLILCAAHAVCRSCCVPSRCARSAMIHSP